MYKKLLSSLAALGTVAVTAASVVSCTPIQYADGIDGQRVITVTDGGHINDHSFNEDALNGVRQFVSEAYGLPGKNDYIESGGTDTTSLVGGYRLAIMKKANVVVMPGFSHVTAMGNILKEYKKHNINTVLVDGLYTDPDTKKEDPRVISILFNSQIAGFMAGYDAAFLMGTTYNDKPVMQKDKTEKYTLKYDVNGDGEIHMSTFAAMHSKYGVDNYMYGYLLGMAVYNEVVDANPDKQTGDKPWVKVKSGNNKSGKIEDLKASSDSDPDFFSGSFDLGQATKKAIPDKLINTYKSDVIFPVAGPQIKDIMDTASTVGRDPYLIGVDVDQAEAYKGEAAGRFITSAIKNIHTAVPQAIYRANSKDIKNPLITNRDDQRIKDNNLTPEQGITDDGVKEFEATKDEQWLGRDSNDFGQFVNWSIDYTQQSFGEDKKFIDPNKKILRYQLPQNFIKLFDPNNTETKATGAMALINTTFADYAGTDKDNPDVSAGSYLDGKKITKFAKDLVAKYGSTVTDNVLDWFKGGN